MQTFLIITAIYIASVFLNRFLNQLSVRYFNDKVEYGMWYLSFMTTFLYVIYFIYEINKRYKPLSTPSKWFVGENWCQIEGWKRFNKSNVIRQNDYEFMLNHDPDKIIVGRLTYNGDTIIVVENHRVVNPNYPVYDQISHFRNRITKR